MNFYKSRARPSKKRTTVEHLNINGLTIASQLILQYVYVQLVQNHMPSSEYNYFAIQFNLSEQ